MNGTLLGIFVVVGLFVSVDPFYDGMKAFSFAEHFPNCLELKLMANGRWVWCGSTSL